MAVNVVTLAPSTHFVDSVYVDSNILLHARNRKSTDYRKAATLLGRLISQNTKLYISSLVIDEIWWSTLRIAYRNITGKFLTPRDLKTDPSILSRYSYFIENTTNKILKIPNFRMVSENPNHVWFINDVLDILKNQELAPRDSFHLGLTISGNIKGFATGDSDFDSLSLPAYDLTVYKY